MLLPPPLTANTAAQLSACTALRYLRLRENLLEDLPIWLGKLTALQQLDLVGNRLKTLPLEVVLKLTGLTSLALSEYVFVSLLAELVV